jgi:hypothetical protein
MQLLAIGVVGEYLARMFIETKQRPLYLIRRHYQAMKSSAPALFDQGRQLR